VTLQRRTLLIVGLTLLALQVLVGSLGTWLLVGTFRTTEQFLVLQMLNLGERLLQDRLKQVEQWAITLGVWDDAYRFTQDTTIDFVDQTFIAENLTADILKLTFNSDLAWYSDKDGQTVFATMLDPRGQTRRLPPEVTQLLIQPAFDRQQPLQSGLVLVGQDVLLFAVHQVTKSNGQGTGGGYVVVGHWLDADFTQRLREYLGILLPVNPLDGTRMATPKAQIRATTTAGSAVDVIDLSGGTDSKRWLKDFSGVFSIELAIEFKSLVASLGWIIFMTNVLLVTVIGLVFAATLYWQLDRVVLRRLLRLSHEAKAMRAENNLASRLTSDQNDEITTVASEINRLLDHTNQLTSDLQAAIIRSESALAAKSGFLGRVSHELRTPMNGVLGFTQLLEFENLSTDQLDYVTQIRRSGQHLLGLINDLLDINQAETQELGLSLEPVNWREVVVECLDIVRSLATAKGVQLLQQVPDAFYSQADRRRLKQVLLNLLSNAIKYNRERDGRILMRLQAQVQHAQAGWRLSVQDTGLGLGPQEIKRLFTPFDRLGAELSQVEGSGLGLMLSKHLVEAMGGSMSVESTLGEGSVFSLWLPEALAKAPTLLEVPPETPPAATANSQRAREVLYIEDNPANQSLMTSIFALRPQVRLHLATNGSHGLNLAASLPQLHLILLDLHLPDLDGEEVLQHLRQSKQQKVPVVVVSADATRERVVRLLEAGAQDYLSKPIEVAAVLELLDTLSDG
jgi:signal transduction histidine kinase/ActR/RegA family two-component response regulator